MADTKKSRTAALSPAVRASNALTARWCTRLGGEDFVLSGAGLWPLLALLASAADEVASAELALALGRPVEAAQHEALELIEILRTGESTTAALGLWAGEGIPLQQDWASRIPAAIVGIITDQEALDRWATQETGGLINKFPLEIAPETALVLASALAARVKWREPFDTHPRNGDWESTEPDQQWLSRNSYDLTAAAVLDDAVTRVVIEGDGDIDVHLLVGEQVAGEVLAAGLRELSGEAKVCLATELGSVAPALEVTRVPSWELEDILLVEAAVL